MLDKNSANYRALLYHFKTVALKLTPEDAKPAIVQLNKLHKNFMRICSASLFSWYLNKYSAEWQKGTVIIDLVTACRSMIVEDAAEKKNYLDTSILYLEKLAQITSSDAFMENVTCEGLALINLTAEEHAVRVDQDEFIQKFRKN